MGQALYRKYRSKKLSEIIGQEHITRTLEQALQGGKISHAYLFTGPRGTGKTSIARILAHEINQLPYEDDSPHIDIIEIDAASNRRIDEIRDLRDKVYTAPAAAKYKVYIIDEVHMLTREAFNALLKTLEEPPAHAVFILATTDVHKLPDTIISRTQRYNFKPVPKQQVIEHLESIANQEGIEIAPEALELLAEHGEGSFRDSISLLDQAGSHGETVAAEEVRLLLGIPPQAALVDLLAALASTANTADIMRRLNDLFEQGYQASAIAKRLGEQLRVHVANNRLLLPSDITFDLLGSLIEVPVAHNPERFLEVVLLRARATAEPISHTPAPSQAAPVTASVSQTVRTKPQTPSKAPSKAHTSPTAQVKADTKNPSASTEASKDEPPVSEASAHSTAVFDAAVWPHVLEALKKKHNTLYGVVRMAEPVCIDNEHLQLKFGFSFHQKRIAEPANRQILATIIKDLTNQSVSIECVYSKEAKAPAPVTTADKATVAPGELDTISNIFGGGELLES